MASAKPSQDALAASSRPRAASSASSTATTNTVLRNALRYTVSPREYAALHKYVLSRSRALRRAAPTPASLEKAATQPGRTSGGSAVGGSSAGDFNARAVRHALRVFVVTWMGMKGWEAVAKKMGGGE